MKLKLKSGGIVKLQNAATTIPATNWNEFPKQLNLTSFTIPANIPEDPKPLWERIKDIWQNRVKVIRRPSKIGPVVSAYGQHAKVVEHGGEIS